MSAHFESHFYNLAPIARPVSNKFSLVWSARDYFLPHALSSSTSTISVWRSFPLLPITFLRLSGSCRVLLHGLFRLCMCKGSPRVRPG